MSLVEEIVMACVALIKAAVAAKEDDEKMDEALMKAQEDLAEIRAKAKFG